MIISIFTGNERVRTESVGGRDHKHRVITAAVNILKREFKCSGFNTKQIFICSYRQTDKYIFP